MSTIERYEAAKWLKIPVLLDVDEMRALFSALGSCTLVLLGRLVARDAAIVSQETFLQSVQQWIEALQKGRVPTQADLQRVLAAALTADLESLLLQEMGAGRVLVKPRRPVIQLQAHFFSYSAEEQKIYSGIFGKESIFWGVQFSYPQIYLDPKEQMHVKVGDQFPNTALFRTLQRWVRNATQPMKLYGKAFPLRMGKGCCSWIHQHPQLVLERSCAVSCSERRDKNL
jgi:hypothetical protein